MVTGVMLEAENETPNVVLQRLKCTSMTVSREPIILHWQPLDNLCLYLLISASLTIRISQHWTQLSSAADGLD
jgi:hypothetical protein